MYIVAKAPERGVLVKQAGEVQADPVTGQLTTSFDGLPPLPYSSFEFDLREGPRAPLITPRTCGTYTTVARLYPFSNPSVATERTASFTIGSGANGGACASSEAQLPNTPSLQAGTVTPLAGAFSPLVFKVSREDGSQRLGVDHARRLPEGVLGKLAGVPYCSDAQIAAAAARSGEGEGALEQASPSCPEASQVGVVNITAGAGSEPYAVQGKAYLAGPVQERPVESCDHHAGDRGTVRSRAPSWCGWRCTSTPNTAQISAVSDPLPTILDGIPLDVRSVSLEMNRAGFTFNPTSCEAMSVTGQAISTLGQAAVLSNRFQVGGCQGSAVQTRPHGEHRGEDEQNRRGELDREGLPEGGGSGHPQGRPDDPDGVAGAVDDVAEGVHRSAVQRQPRRLPCGGVHRDREGDHADPERPACGSGDLGVAWWCGVPGRRVPVAGR